MPCSFLPALLAFSLLSCALPRAEASACRCRTLTRDRDQPREGRGERGRRGETRGYLQMIMQLVSRRSGQRGFFGSVYSAPDLASSLPGTLRHSQALPTAATAAWAVNYEVSRGARSRRRRAREKRPRCLFQWSINKNCLPRYRKPRLLLRDRSASSIRGGSGGGGQSSRRNARTRSRFDRRWTRW